MRTYEVVKYPSADSIDRDLFPEEKYREILTNLYKLEKGRYKEVMFKMLYVEDYRTYSFFTAKTGALYTTLFLCSEGYKSAASENWLQLYRKVAIELPPSITYKEGEPLLYDAFYYQGNSPIGRNSIRYALHRLLKYNGVMDESEGLENYSKTPHDSFFGYLKDYTGITEDML